MKKSIALIALASLALFTACGGPKYDLTNQTWDELAPAEGSKRPTVRMNSVLDENLFFKIKYDPAQWELKVSNGEYPTNLYFSHTAYKNDSCVLLPGTKGYELEKDYKVTQWQYKSDITAGIDYEFANPITGQVEMRVYEDQSNGAGFPTTLFELQMPLDDQDPYQCRYDYEQLIGTYVFDSYEGTPEELQAIMNQLEATKKLNEEIEKQKALEEVIDAAQTASGS